MTEHTEQQHDSTDFEQESDDAAASEPEDRVNISKLREMALRGSKYREAVDFEYAGLSGDLYVGGLPDPEFLPIAAMLEARLGIDTDEAQEMLEEEKDPEGNIDPSNFDAEFVAIMTDAAVRGIDPTQGIAEGETEAGLREIFGRVREDGSFVGIGLQGGKTLVIAEKVLQLSSDAEKAESFRGVGRGQ